MGNKVEGEAEGAGHLGGCGSAVQLKKLLPDQS